MESYTGKSNSRISQKLLDTKEMFVISYNVHYCGAFMPTKSIVIEIG